MDGSQPSTSGFLPYTPAKPRKDTKRKSPNSTTDEKKSPKRRRFTAEPDPTKFLPESPVIGKSLVHKQRTIKKGICETVSSSRIRKDVERKYASENQHPQVASWLKIAKFIPSDPNFYSQVKNTFLSLNLKESKYLCNVKCARKKKEFFENKIKAPFLQQTIDCLFTTVKSFEKENRKKADLNDLPAVMEAWSKGFDWDIHTVRLHLIILKRALSENSPLMPNNDHHRLAIYLASRCDTEGLKTCIIDLVQSISVPLLEEQTINIPRPLEMPEAEEQARQLLKGNLTSNIKLLCEEEEAPVPEGISKQIWVTANNFVIIWPIDDKCELGYEFNRGEKDMMNSEYYYYSLLQAFDPDSTLSDQDTKLLTLLIDLAINHKKTIFKIGAKRVDWRDWFLLFKPGFHSLAPGMDIPDDYTLIHNQTIIKPLPSTASSEKSDQIQSTPEIDDQMLQSQTELNKTEKEIHLLTSDSSDQKKITNELKSEKEVLKDKHDALTSEHNNLKDRYTSLREESEAMEKKLITEQACLAGAEIIIAEQYQEINELKERVNNLKSEKEMIKDKHDALQSEHDHLKDRYTSLREESETKTQTGVKPLEHQQEINQLKEQIESFKSKYRSAVSREAKVRLQKNSLSLLLKPLNERIQTLENEISAKQDDIDLKNVEILRLSVNNAQKDLELKQLKDEYDKLNSEYIPLQESLSRKSKGETSMAEENSQLRQTIAHQEEEIKDLREKLIRGEQPQPMHPLLNEEDISMHPLLNEEDISMHPLLNEEDISIQSLPDYEDNLVQPLLNEKGFFSLFDEELGTTFSEASPSDKAMKAMDEADPSELNQ